MDFQCSWPVLQTQNSDALKALILADTHLLGSRKGHWLDKWRREWQMHRSFQTIITLHQPDAVFLLGKAYLYRMYQLQKKLSQDPSQGRHTSTCSHT